MHRRPIEHPTEALEFGAALSSAMAPTTPNDARGECPPDSPPRVPDSSKHWHDAKKAKGRSAGVAADQHLLPVVVSQVCFQARPHSEAQHIRVTRRLPIL